MTPTRRALLVAAMAASSIGVAAGCAAHAARTRAADTHVDALPANGDARLALVGSGAEAARPSSAPPPVTPAPAPAPEVVDPHVRHCLDELNRYRAAAALPALALDARLSTFSLAASLAIADGGAAHGYFGVATHSGALWTHGFCRRAAENQARGWSLTATTVDELVDAMLETMFAEGPGGGHHDNMLDPDLRRVGIGLVVRDERLWLTNDFSPGCP